MNPKAPAIMLADFLAPLFPSGGHLELRALPGKIQAFIPPRDIQALRRFLADHRDRNLYFGVAARRDSTSGALDNCGPLAALFVDIDFKTLPEPDARARLDAFPLAPSAIVASGGGLHAYWLLREQLDLQTEAAYAKEILRRLARHLGGDVSAAEPARVLRVPGTFNRKPEYDPPRQVVLERFEPERRYDMAEFDRLLPAEPIDSHVEAFTVPERIGDGKRNTVLYHFARSLKSKRCTSAEILAALETVNRTRCDPPLPVAEVQEIAEHAAAQADRPAFRATEKTVKVSDGNDLHQTVRAVMLDRIPAFDKRRQVTALVNDALGGIGEFCRTRDGRLFFFSKVERRLFDLDQRPFQHLLTGVSGLSATEAGFRFVLDVLQANTFRTAPLVDVHTLAHFDPATGLLAVSDGEGGVWLRERRGGWSYTHNGDHGLLFLTEPEATAGVPEFGSNGGALRWFLDLPLFADHPLSREDQQTLYYVDLLHNFYPPLRRTRMIPACLGPQGSGKTTALRLRGRLLLGPRFDVTALHRDREDAFVAAVTNRAVCALDNADSRIPWLEDALATYATGLRYRLRRLYTTNEEVSYEPQAVLMLSSRDPQFNRPDVAERLLPFYFERPEKYEAEERIFRELEVRRGAIWGQLLTRLGEIADGLAETEAPALPFRMADFAAFGWRVFAPLGQAAEWEALLRRVEGVQAAFAGEGDGVVEALRILLQREGSLGPLAVGDLFKRCREVAEQEGLPLPRTAQGFGRRLTLLKRVIELELRARLFEERRHADTRWVTLTPRDGGDGGGGGDDGGKVSVSEGKR